MDSFVLDITDIKEKVFTEGDYFCLLDNSNISSIIKNSELISYELLTLLGSRLVRDYNWAEFIQLGEKHMKVIINIVGSIGHKSLKFIANIGNFFLYCLSAISWIFRPPWYFKKVIFQIIDIGYFSLPVVGLTTFFSGMVLAIFWARDNKQLN